eukprot:11963-Chlamydomonas_euryale.AAC.1
MKAARTGCWRYSQHPGQHDSVFRRKLRRMRQPKRDSPAPRRCRLRRGRDAARVDARRGCAMTRAHAHMVRSGAS